MQIQHEACIIHVLSSAMHQAQNITSQNMSQLVVCCKLSGTTIPLATVFLTACVPCCCSGQVASTMVWATNPFRRVPPTMATSKRAAGMASECVSITMVITTRVNGRWVCGRAWACSSVLTTATMLVSIAEACAMALVPTAFPTETVMWVSVTQMCPMGMGHICLPVGKPMRVSGPMAGNMAGVCTLWRMDSSGQVSTLTVMLLIYMHHTAGHQHHSCLRSNNPGCVYCLNRRQCLALGMHMCTDTCGTCKAGHWIKSSHVSTAVGT